MRSSAVNPAIVASRASTLARNWPRISVVYFATMPPKRKRNDAHQAPSAPAEVPSRRSSRRIRRNNHDDGVEGKTGDDATHQLDKLSSKEAVAQAMQTLSKMEHKLLDDAKRQRLAIEASSIRTMTAKKGVNGDGAVPMTSSKRAAEPKPKARTAEKKVKTEPDVPAGEPSSLDDEVGDRGSRRPPPVNSDKLPLPWTGRLGYACLNTYLRNASTPVFSSRTCRISSILEHRYPLQDPTQPEHPTKNRPDNTQQPNVERGMKYIQEIGLNNARDIVKMIRWNDKYGIKFMRLSSEMFPFASHAEYGYGLSFAADVLASAGKVASDLGHRLTTHPGQFTQIGSPRKEVVSAAIRDLEYHNEMLTRLNLSHQLNRDAVMILHMGGTFGDKAATLDRFRENYSKLSIGVQQRLVLENDDVSWSVHDLLPICEELNIPLVLDFHHHNIVFDPSIREGTLDIIPLYDRIKSTWTRKGITQKMHYSEPCPPAITARDRRKHSPRVKTMPPCAPDMDLMIEAKDKEQAVFDLMRHFKLPGWDLFNNIIPYERDDEPKKAPRGKASKASKGKKQENGVPPVIEHEAPEQLMAPEEIGMGGEERRVYWPEGMEEWLRPKKREMKNGSKSGVKDKEMKKVEDDA